MMGVNYIYAIVVVVLFVLGFGSVYLKRKFNIKQDEIDLLNLILDVVNYLSKTIEFKYKDDVSAIVTYCFRAIVFVDDFEKIEDLDMRKLLVKEKAVSFCAEHGMDLDDGIVEIVDKIVEYIFKNYMKLQ